MKKLVLIIAIMFSNIGLISAVTSAQDNQEDSYKCRLKAFQEAQESGYEYASKEWQWIYYSEKKMCEME